MQAVVLAGGLGTRLRPLTLSLPKPMVRVGGRPFLEYQLLYLAKFGIQDVLLLTGYMGEVVEDYFSDGRSQGLRLRYSREKEPMGTGGALMNAVNYLEESFFLLYGDSFLPMDYRDAKQAFLGHGKLAMMVVYDNAEDTSVQNNVRIDEETLMVIDYSKQGSGMCYVEAGVLVLKREVLNFLPKSGSFSMEEKLYPSLIDGGEMAAYKSVERFFDIGTPTRLKAFETVINKYFKREKI